MSLLLAFLCFLISPAGDAGAGTRPHIERPDAVAPGILTPDSRREEQDRPDCLSEDSDEGEGEEEDGDSIGLSHPALPRPISTSRGPVVRRVAAGRQALAISDRDSRSALLRC